ncbi:lipopolysaccharide kinase InaA family protein [Candidatus Nitrospira allomarina]|uniref:Lipopolysaccharide kinase InaA family protein n=1 Tax=Candidatus Nitrospira allomarina TaxID=3020900 RepID=A0AA96G9H8_9BACT|nr:lipopolysaccharide kinase InaA family protein [Candidatus Nitrospira allomarina]WNM57381.1 lipopolysaccharide kinase InaA family protein [Candidatus Nitrospira allomarina]
MSRPAKRHVRKLSLEVAGQKKKFFLKQSGFLSFHLFLKSWCRLQVPLSGTARELLLLELFRDQGIPVMNAVAWGEHTVLGWPVRGFILVEEVVGREFVDVYRGASLRVRRRLFRLYGELMGTLHRIGIDSKVRPEDLICVSDNYKDFRNCFVVIDREHGRPYLMGLSIEQCGIRLGDIWAKGMYRIGLGERSELLAFLSGYLTAAGQRSVSEGRDAISANLVKRASRRAAKVLYHDNRFEMLRTGFQVQYGIGLDRFIP